MSQSLSYLIQRLKPFMIQYIQQLSVTPTEGPGIDIVAPAQVGLGGDTILIYDSAGAPVAEFAFTAAGLILALAAATSGDAVELPAGTITFTNPVYTDAGTYTYLLDVPAGVILRGQGRGKSTIAIASNTNVTKTTRTILIHHGTVIQDMSISAAYTGTTNKEIILINGYPTESPMIFGLHRLDLAFSITTSVYGFYPISCPYINNVAYATDLIISDIEIVSTKAATNTGAHGMYLLTTAAHAGTVVIRNIVASFYGGAIHGVELNGTSGGKKNEAHDISVYSYTEAASSYSYGMTALYWNLWNVYAYLKHVAASMANESYALYMENLEAHNVTGQLILTTDASTNPPAVYTANVKGFGVYGYCTQDGTGLALGIQSASSVLVGFYGYGNATGGGSGYGFEDYTGNSLIGGIFYGSTTDVLAAGSGFYGAQYLTSTGAIVYLPGDRAAYSVEDYHATDIEAGALTRHLPLPGAAGGIARSDGSNWVRVELDDYLGVRNITTITAGATTLNTTYDVVLCNAAAGAITVNLPAAASNTGRAYTIKKIDATANTVTVDPNGGETIDDDGTLIIDSQYSSAQIVCDGSEWWIV